MAEFQSSTSLEYTLISHPNFQALPIPFPVNFLILTKAYLPADCLICIAIYPFTRLDSGFDLVEILPREIELLFLVRQTSHMFICE
jgi:hypothetical protein